ncbi:MAG TPA: phosphopentomutase/phosphoglucosamine mutase [Methanoregulaceae archaeon]|nr:phosphopentomutase/phosphoglucosamine mutase [Methanoregulaceae archaeon]
MLFGSSGVRRKFGYDLVSIGLSLGSALASRSHEIILGMDTRTTSPVISHAILAGITGSGGTALHAGIVPTPTVAFSARYHSAGCMITASHNPEEYNGIKLFNPDGSSFTRQQQDEMEDRIPSPCWAGWDDQGTVGITDAITPHSDAILSRISIDENLPVVADCGNGAGSMVTPTLLRDAGARMTLINCNPSGHFSRPSEPLESNLPYLGEVVRKTRAACAVVHDGDADRMMAFDVKGRYISGDHLLMLFAKYQGAKRVVTTTDASMLIEEIADVHRTPVGDAFVSEELLSWGDFGGEPSGAWIFPEISLCPDGPFAAALFCEIASEWNVADELDAMPRYPILRGSFPNSTARDTMIALGASNPTNGIRIEEEDGWCLIRASGTEPKIRITAEGRTKDAAERMFERGRSLLTMTKTA